jgi:serine/threonine protein kinase
MTPPTIPGFELLLRIGSSDDSEVWLARSRSGKHLALELCPIHALGVQDLRRIRSLERRIRRHRKFVAVRRMVEHAGFYFRAMELPDDIGASPRASVEEYVPHTAREHLKRGLAYDFDATVRIAMDALEALAHLHARNLVHGAVQPGRIVFVGGRAKLADPGLTALNRGRADRSSKLDYGAPDSAPSPGGDLYSLGITLHEMLTRIGPDRFPELPADLEQAELETYRRFAPVIDRACAPDEQARFHSAREFRDALSDRIADPDISGVRDGWPTMSSAGRIWPWTKRHSWVIAAVVLALGGGIALALA